MTFQKCTLTLCKALYCLGYFNFFFLFFYVYSRMPIFKLKRSLFCLRELFACLCCDAALLTAPHVVCCDYRSICAFPHLHFTHFVKTSQVSLHCSQYDYIYWPRWGKCANWAIWHIVNLRQNESCPAVDVCGGVMSSANILSWHKAVCWLCQQNIGISL